MGLSKQQATGLGAAIGGVLGAVVGGDVSHNRSVGRCNGLLLGALAGGLLGAQMGSSIQLIELDDGSVRLDIPGSVLFPTVRFALGDGFKSTLDRVGQTIQTCCGLTAQVVGHTDNVGADALNDKLSLDRANAVVDYLIKAGVPARSLSANGMGERKPLADNGSEQGRQRNPRVEILVRPPAG